MGDKLSSVHVYEGQSPLTISKSWFSLTSLRHLPTGVPTYPSGTPTIWLEPPGRRAATRKMSLLYRFKCGPIRDERECCKASGIVLYVIPPSHPLLLRQKNILPHAKPTSSNNIWKGFNSGLKQNSSSPRKSTLKTASSPSLLNV